MHQGMAVTQARNILFPSQHQGRAFVGGESRGLIIAEGESAGLARKYLRTQITRHCHAQVENITRSWRVGNRMWRDRARSEQSS